MHEATVREIYLLFNGLQPDQALRHFHEDAVWEWPPGGPDAGVFRGHQAIADAALRWRDSWGEFWMEPLQVIERGDEVLVMCHYHATGLGSGVPIESDIAHLWEFRGERVARWRMFAQAEAARRRFLED